MTERTLRGLPASPGVAIGPAWRYSRTSPEPEARPATSPDEEGRRLREAQAEAVTELERLAAGGDPRLGDEDRAIFEAHRLMIEDPDLSHRVEQRIAEGMSAETAWSTAVEDYAEVLGALDSEVLRERAADLRDVGHRVMRRLVGEPAGIDQPAEPSIVIAEGLTPSDTVELDPERVLGFATQGGGPTSHATILARRMGVPAVVGLGEALGEVEPGAEVVLDGTAGTVTLGADPETVRAAVGRRQQWLQGRSAAAEAAQRGPGRTRDGVTVEVAANVGGVTDAEEAARVGADGIGLLRTEFLYVGRDEAPDEEELVEAFGTIFRLAGEGLVVVRTLDLGGDKPLPYLSMGAEPNPFLGVRGIRLSRERPRLMKVQVRAMLRAAAGVRLGIMFPMVSTVEEARWAAAMVHQSVSGLPAEERPAQLQVGIMVEVPSAALLADRLSPLVDFFSLGTNDLAQYTLAADRTNPGVAGMADGLHPAVLSLIKSVADAGARHGIWTGVCGEVAAERAAVPILIGLGVRELSVNPVSVAEVKLELSRWDSGEAARLALRALGLGSGQEVRELVAEHRGGP